MRRLVALLISCFSVLYSSDKDCRVRDFLGRIPKEDQKEIADFFKGLLSHGDTASVLLGDKPSAVTSITSWLARWPNCVWEPMFLEYRGWHIWEKYSSQIPLKVVFIEEPDGRDAVHMWIAKKECQKSIEQFLSTKLVGVTQRKAMGLLLGYPEEDVEGFVKAQSLETTLAYFPYESSSSSCWIDPHRQDVIKDSSHDLNKLIEELEQQWILISSWKNDGPFFCCCPYNYRSFSKPDESKIENFKQQLVRLYNSENFLEEILQLLIAD